MESLNTIKAWSNIFHLHSFLPSFVGIHYQASNDGSSNLPSKSEIESFMGGINKDVLKHCIETGNQFDDGFYTYVLVDNELIISVDDKSGNGRFVESISLKGKTGANDEYYGSICLVDELGQIVRVNYNKNGQPYVSGPINISEVKK